MRGAIYLLLSREIKSNVKEMMSKKKVTIQLANERGNKKTIKDILKEGNISLGESSERFANERRLFMSLSHFLNFPFPQEEEKL